MNSIKILHLINHNNFHAHLGGLQPGKRFKEMTLDDAVASMDMEVIHMVLRCTGFTRLKHYHKHLLGASHQGDPCIEVVRFLLENKSQLHGPRPFQSQIIQFGRLKSHDKILELLFQYAHLWNEGFSNLMDQTRAAYESTRDEFYARFILKHHPNPSTTLFGFTMFCKSITFADELMEVAKRANGDEDDEIKLAKTLFKHALRRNDMPMMRHLYDRRPSKMTGVLSDDLAWFVIMLLSQPLTHERKEALIYAMSTVFAGAKDKIAYAFYMINDEDLISQPQPVDINVDFLANPYFHPNDFFEIVRKSKCDNIPADRLSELLNKHISDDRRERLRRMRPLVTPLVPDIIDVVTPVPDTIATMQRLLQPPPVENYTVSGFRWESTF